jgi:hypothetical protein
VLGLLKTDVEGYERSVFAGAADALPSGYTSVLLGVARCCSVLLELHSKHFLARGKRGRHDAGAERPLAHEPQRSPTRLASRHRAAGHPAAPTVCRRLPGLGPPEYQRTHSGAPTTTSATMVNRPHLAPGVLLMLRTPPDGPDRPAPDSRRRRTGRSQREGSLVPCDTRVRDDRIACRGSCPLGAIAP